MTSQADARPLMSPVQHDVPCIICHYDLRHQPSEGACPECGAPVEWSTRSKLLRHADLSWLRRLAIGSRLLTASYAAGLIASAIFLYLGVVHELSTYLDITPEIRLLQIAGFFAGGWLLTTPEFRHSHRTPHRASRSLLRIALIAISLTMSYRALVNLGLISGIALDTVAVHFVYLVAFFSFELLVTWMFLREQERLAMRVPATRLKLVILMARWVYGIYAIVVAGWSIYFQQRILQLSFFSATPDWMMKVNLISIATEIPLLALLLYCNWRLCKEIGAAARIRSEPALTPTTPPRVDQTTPA